MLKNPFKIISNNYQYTAASLALFTLIIYLLTLCRTIPGGDSGELIAGAYTLGVLHPPGYPLFTLLGKLFTFIPFGSVAWRVNFLSAVCNTAAASLLFLSIFKLTKNNWAALLAAGLFAFSPLIWAYAVVAEVFGLNNFFISLMLYLMIRYYQERSIRIAYLGAFIFGLGMTNHHTFFFYAFPFALCVFWTGRKQLLNFKSTGLICLLFFTGLLLYIYIPIASTQIPTISWGNQSTWKGFLDHVLRREYGTFQLANRYVGHEQFWNGIFLYFIYLPQQLLYVGIILPFIGIYYSLKKNSQWKKIILLTLFCFVLYIIVFHKLANLPLHIPLYLNIHMRFWQQPNLLMFFWSGIGFYYILTHFQNIPNSSDLSNRSNLSNLRNLPKNLFPLLAILLVLIQCLSHYKKSDQHNNWATYNFGKGLIGPLSKNALFISKGDIQTNTARYLINCEGFRTDIKIIDRELLRFPWFKRIAQKDYPNVTLPGPLLHPKIHGAYNLKMLLDANREKFPLFLTTFTKQEKYEKWKEGYDVKPFGYIFKVYPKGSHFDFFEYMDEATKSLPNLKESDQLISYPKGTWESVVRRAYWEAHNRFASAIAPYALKHGKNPKLLQKARVIYENLEYRFPDAPPFFWKNFGVIYNSLRARDPKANEGLIRVWTKYLKIAPPNDKELDNIRYILSRIQMK